MYHDRTATSGVWATSTPSAYEGYIIFCVGQDPYKIAAFRSWATSKGIGFKSLKGCYRGQMEDSFIVNARSFPLVEPWTNDEESILYLTPQRRKEARRAVLMYRDGRSEQLGHFMGVGRDTAHCYSSWTYDPTTDDYYVCV